LIESVIVFSDVTEIAKKYNKKHEIKKPCPASSGQGEALRIKKLDLSGNMIHKFAPLIHRKRLHPEIFRNTLDGA